LKLVVDWCEAEADWGEGCWLADSEKESELLACDGEEAELLMNRLDLVGVGEADPFDRDWSSCWFRIL
jgi:hypothetical protein